MISTSASPAHGDVDSAAAQGHVHDTQMSETGETCEPGEFVEVTECPSPAQKSEPVRTTGTDQDVAARSTGTGRPSAESEPERSRAAARAKAGLAEGGEKGAPC